jgi:hypothetical protein
MLRCGIGARADAVVSFFVMLRVVLVRIQQVMQEQGIKRVVVRDAAASDPEQPLAQYVGLVSDTSIFKRLGLYPEDGAALDEFEPDFHQQVLHSGSSVGGSGQVTPAANSRAATPVGLAPAAGHLGEQAAGTAAPVSSRRAGAAAGGGDGGAGAPSAADILTIPDHLMVMREVGQGSTFSSVGSLTSCGSSSCAAADVQSNGSASSTAVAAAAAAAAAATTTRDSGVAAAAGLNLHHEGSGSTVLSEPDALSRYKTAASLWEVDMADMDMIRRIGEGSFGEVMLATFRGTKVRRGIAAAAVSWFI